LKRVRARVIALAILAAVGMGVWALPSSNLGTRSDRETPPPTTFGTDIQALTPLTVELVEPGAEPRQVLAHDIAEGSSWTGDLLFDLSVESVTTVHIEGESHLDTESVGAEGSVTAQYGLRDLDVSAQLGDPDVPPREGNLDITGRVVVGPDRTATAATVSAEATGDLAGIDAVAAGLDPRLSSLLFPFPSEPIGNGARWDITGPLPLFGTGVVLEAEARLERRRGGRFDIVVTLSLATPEDQDGPAIDLTGFGEIQGDVASLGPSLGSIVTSGGIVLPDRSPDPLPMTMELQLSGR